ncbi:MAG: MTH1187 family thiamine-binding protein [Desulfofundulus sp.]|uniref:MTH1187 family thiamine-binding protein n=1 Tax=Desulfofundulus sp. TaxID=2282750 RepID=UPI003C73E1A0
MAIVEVSVMPMGTDDPSVSSYISHCYEVLKGEPGLKHQVTPMSTIIEGELDRVLDAVKKMHRAPFNDGVMRVVTSITIDERLDKGASMEDMVRAVLQ